MMAWLNLVALPFLARLFLVVLFPFSSLDKVVNHKQALQQANSSFIPGGNMLLVLGIVTEIGTSVSILFGWHDPSRRLHPGGLLRGDGRAVPPSSGWPGISGRPATARAERISGTS